MSSAGSIRAMFPSWPDHNRRLRDRVAALSEAELAIRPGPDRWPIWATIGHLACQRVFWLCDFAGEPGAAESPFPNAGFNCPGDDDLETVWSAAQLVDALDRTFAIVDHALETWTPASLEDVIDHSKDWGDPGRVHSRGWLLQRGLSHDVWHTSEISDALSAAGLEPIDFWEQGSIICHRRGRRGVEGAGWLVLGIGLTLAAATWFLMEEFVRSRYGYLDSEQVAGAADGIEPGNLPLAFTFLGDVVFAIAVVVAVGRRTGINAVGS